MKNTLLVLSLILLLTGQVFAQQQVGGYVKNADGEPMPGVSVVIKGTTNGVVTNKEGYYTITDLSSEDILVFTFLSMLTEEIMVGEQTKIDITMVDDIMNLDEVVIVGYGEIKRANLTGAISDIKSDDLLELPTTDLASTLQGKLAGVKIGRATGKPGATTNITIRTNPNFSKLEQLPLYVIDGVIYDKENGGLDQFNNLDPSEIESISILKDAAAAIYGTRAESGVIMVKTKQGKKGKTTFNYSGAFGINRATQVPEMLSAYEHASMLNYIYENDERNDAIIYDSYTEDELEAFKNTDYNWLDGMWNKNAYTKKHSLNMSGGSENIRYFMGGSYYNEEGNMKNLYSNRYSFRSNLQANVAKNITTSLSINVSHKESKQPNYAAEESSGVLRDTYKRLLTSPRWIPYEINGLPVANNMEGWQPYAVQETGSYKANSDNYSTIMGNLEYNIPIIKGLKTGVQFSYTSTNNTGKEYSQDYLVYTFKGEGEHRHIITDEANEVQKKSNEEGLRESSSKSSSYQLNTYLEYKRQFGQHEISSKLIYEQTESKSSGFNASLSNADVPGIEQLWAFTDGTAVIGSNASESGRLAYLGRVNYSYAQRYLLEGIFRNEASQSFDPRYAWGFFPGGSVGWIMSKENFFKSNISFINFFKLRFSAGILGADNTRSFAWKYQFVGNEEGAIIGDNLTNAIKPRNNGLSNPTVTWAKTYYYDGGFDMRIFQNKLSIGFDYYYKLATDILYERKAYLPVSVGIDQAPSENYGEGYGKGIDLEIGYKGKISNDFKYTINGNFSWSTNMKTIVDQSSAAVGRWDDQTLNNESNQPGLICLGIIRNEEDLALARSMYDSIGNTPVEMGMLYYKDIRGENYSEGPDGKINQFDRTTIAEYTSPPFNYGLTLGASWKDISLSITLVGEFGHKVFIEKDEMDLPTATSNVFSFWNDYWTPSNPNASMPRPYRYGEESQISTFWMRDGNALRVNNIRISYNLPEGFLQKVKIASARIYFSGSNIWTIISPFDFKDPSVSRAYDYPMLRTFNFGVDVKL